LKAFLTVARTRTAGGAELTLQEHDGEFYLKLDGRQLMSTDSCLSETLLGELASAAVRGAAHPRLLIGGLGLGFTLRSVLQAAGPQAEVHLAEIVPDVIAWNRDLLGGVNGKLLDDPRVKIFAEDVFPLIARVPQATYDAILLDLDDGPAGFLQGRVSYTYDRRGCLRIARALKPHGCAAFWSAAEDLPFVQRLKKFGFKIEAHEAKAHENAKRAAHRIYLATLPAQAPVGRTPDASRQRRRL
jgi:spermidine synthase